ncbi:MAG: hypothetical protein H7Y12_06035 [Sphingobacteriaceae bacterium]|nr:hypothetical protein [Cytophagaceae bacterium]
METKSGTLRSFEINFQTAGIIPPPYAHRYSLRGTPNPNGGLDVRFDIQYLDRQDLTEEEITSEGFTLSDDFNWEGALLPVWREEVEKLAVKTVFNKTNRAAEDAENRFWLNLERQGEEPMLGKPRNREGWEYASQELIQAVYETAQIESPLKLIYLKKLKDKSVQLEMNVFFSKRTVKTRMQVGNLEKSKNLRWDDLNPILRMIYAGEFLAEKAIEKEPRDPGQYLNVGDGLWYEFGKSLQNPSGNNRYLSEMERTFDDLLPE